MKGLFLQIGHSRQRPRTYTRIYGSKASCVHALRGPPTAEPWGGMGPRWPIWGAWALDGPMHACMLKREERRGEELLL